MTYQAHSPDCPARRRARLIDRAGNVAALFLVLAAVYLVTRFALG